MDLINNLFTNLYNLVAQTLSSLLTGLLGKPLADVIVFLIMGVIVITVLLVMAPVIMLFETWMERKVIARIQDRIGPNRVGPLGLLQPIADMIKMFIKEDIVPRNGDKVVHFLAPVIALMPVVLVLAAIPFGRGMAAIDLNVGLLYLLAVGSIGTIGIFMAGWGSNNKFALIGGMRAVAQIVSYEIPQVLSVLVIVLLTGSLSLNKIVEAQGSWFGLGWFVFKGFPVAPIAMVFYFIAAIAEANRAPFDLPEAESEIVAGHHTEYSGMKWGLFYLAEYLNMFVVSAIGVTLFLGGWQGPILPPWIWFMAKSFAIVFILMWIRGTLPRVRVDQLMGLAWKRLIPLALVLILVTGLLLPIYRPVWSALQLAFLP